MIIHQISKNRNESALEILSGFLQTNDAVKGYIRETASRVNEKDKGFQLLTALVPGLESRNSHRAAIEITQASATFEELDTNQDGVIDRKEFQRADHSLLPGSGIIPESKTEQRKAAKSREAFRTISSKQNSGTPVEIVNPLGAQYDTCRDTMRAQFKAAMGAPPSGSSVSLRTVEDSSRQPAQATFTPFHDPKPVKSLSELAESPRTRPPPPLGHVRDSKSDPIMSPGREESTQRVRLRNQDQDQDVQDFQESTQRVLLRGNLPPPSLNLMPQNPASPTREAHY